MSSDRPGDDDEYRQAFPSVIRVASGGPAILLCFRIDDGVGFESGKQGLV